MPYEILCSLRHLTDQELEARLKSLAGRERDATAQLVAHLAELDTRDLHLRAGYGSLFAYCRDALKLSEAEAYNRIEAARAARRFPLVLVLLGSGAVNLTTVRLLAPHLTFENHRLVLDSARGKARPEVEALVARLAPRPDAAASLRRLPPPREGGVLAEPRSDASPGAAGPGAVGVGLVAPGPVGPGSVGPGPVGPGPVGPGLVATGLVAAGEVSGGTSPPPVVPVETIRVSGLPPPRPAIEALAPDRYRFQVTIGGETLEKLRLARDMLRHANPSGDDAAVLDRALTSLLLDLAKAKFAATDAPRPSRGTGPESRHIPAEVRRVVWLRDLGCCAFVGAEGRRCKERGFVEFHHVRPFAVGGAPTADNIQLRCRRHNAYEARVFFGRHADVRTPDTRGRDARGGNGRSRGARSGDARPP